MSVDAEFDSIDEEIAAIQDELDACARSIIVSRAAIWLGGLALLLAFTFVASLREPTIIFGAIAAMIGGTVWYGASTSSRAEIRTRLGEAEARKAALFDIVAARNGWADVGSTLQ